MKLQKLILAVAFALVVCFSMVGFASAHTTVSHTGSPAQAKPHPNIYTSPSPCNQYPTPWVELESTSRILCIHGGTGYIGLGSNDLPNTYFLDAQGSGGWIRYYDSAGGHFCNFTAGNFNLNYVYVTQVDIGGSQSGAPGC